MHSLPIHEPPVNLRSQRGFALLTAMIFGLIFAVGLAAMYELTQALGVTAALYDKAEYAESLNRSAANVAADFIEQIILDKVAPQGAFLSDPAILTNDLYPSASADWSDTPADSPDLTINHGNGYQSRIDIDFIPLTAGFSFRSIKFGSAYQEASAGNSNSGAQTYRINVLTTGPRDRKFQSEAIYVVTP